MAYKTELDYINSNADIVIRALDVGPGDCLLVQTGSQNILIDTGNVGWRHLLPAALKRYGATTLHKVIITHPHIDHDGNFMSILEDTDNFTVNTCYTNGITLKKASMQEYQYRTLLGNKLKNLKTGDTLDFGNGTLWTTLWPHSTFVTEMQRRTDNNIDKYGNISYNADDDSDSGSYGNEDMLETNAYTYSMNNASIVGRLTKGNFSMLFTGDAGAAVWQSQTESVMGADGTVTKQTFRAGYKVDPSLCKSTVFKAAHHSQSAANLQGFIRDAVQPEHIIMTGGDHQNAYSLSDSGTLANPKKWTKLIPRIVSINKFNNICNVPLTNMWCTRQHGDIHIGIFANHYTVYPDNRDWIWTQTWTDLVNKSIKLTDPKRTAIYWCDGISMGTVTSS